jgi:hypothetical protein
MLHAQARAQPLTQQQYREDFETFWTTIKQNYAYLDKKKDRLGKGEDLLPACGRHHQLPEQFCAAAGKSFL